jgi:hypothetical protein
VWDQSVVEYFGAPAWLSQLSVSEAAFFATFIVFLATIHFIGRVTPMKKSATLNMAALNRVNLFKECFLAYVNAGMLEPILAIASADYDVSTKSLMINLAQLLGLFSWLYLLSDAFDISDTQQAFIYWDRITDCGQKKDLPSWLKRAKGQAAHDEGIDLSGSLYRDLALWSMLGCSFGACCGVFSHRDVIHSHAIIIMWVGLHHQARKATAWRGTGYFHTLFAPSTALLPLEFCLPLQDPEMVGDEDAIGDLEKLRAFIKAESGVELSIEC